MFKDLGLSGGTYELKVFAKVKRWVMMGLAISTLDYHVRGYELFHIEKPEGGKDTGEADGEGLNMVMVGTLIGVRIGVISVTALIFTALLFEN